MTARERLQARTSTKAQRAARDALVYPLRGIRALLLTHNRGAKDLNLAPAYRNLEWCQENYELLKHRLGMFKPEVEKLLAEVEDEVDSFNFSEAMYTEDYITRAVRYYEDNVEDAS